MPADKITPEDRAAWRRQQRAVDIVEYSLVLIRSQSDFHRWIVTLRPTDTARYHENMNTVKSLKAPKAITMMRADFQAYCKERAAVIVDQQSDRYITFYIAAHKHDVPGILDPDPDASPRPLRTDN